MHLTVAHPFFSLSNHASHLSFTSSPRHFLTSTIPHPSRQTVPGSLHQCEATNLFFFDSGSNRPLDVLFLPSANVPDSLRTGDITLDEALQYSPLLALEGITTADAVEYDFTLQIAEGEVVEVRPRRFSRTCQLASSTFSQLTLFPFDSCSVSSPTAPERRSVKPAPSNRLSRAPPPASPTFPQRELRLGMVATFSFEG
jgi:hypothetical protein